jgi:hypothetical protein
MKHFENVVIPIIIWSSNNINILRATILLGVQKYFTRVESLPKESNTQNNEQDIFIDILESKEKIVLISWK